MEKEAVTNYLQEFKSQADEWFKEEGPVLQNYQFIKDFFKRENLEKAEWADIQTIGLHLNCFTSMALARANALGRPNHPLEHYRKSFIYLAHGDGPVVERVRNFAETEEYRLEYFGHSAISELAGYLFPEEFFLWNSRDKFAARFLGIDAEAAREGDFVTRLVRFSNSAEPVNRLYEEIVGRRTNLPLNLEVDQFFSWLYERYSTDENGGGGAGGHPQGVEYWLIAAGEGGNRWEEFLAKGIVAIGWDKLGDLRKYQTKEEIQRALRSKYSKEGSQKNNAKACFEFAHKMKPGDMVFVKREVQTLLGYGQVESPYTFDESRSSYKNVHKVKWHKAGEFMLTGESRLHVKTLTRITSYAEYVAELKAVVGEGDQLVPPKARYWWLNANPQVWNLAEAQVGQVQTYTSHNKEGNKRQKYKYFGEVKPGDLVIGYVTSPKKEIVALCRITHGLHETSEGEGIEFEIVERVPKPVSYEAMQEEPVLAESEPLKSHQGSLFRVSEDEFKVIRALIDKFNPPEAPKAKPYTKEMALASLFLNEIDFDNTLSALQERKNILRCPSFGTR